MMLPSAVLIMILAANCWEKVTCGTDMIFCPEMATFMTRIKKSVIGGRAVKVNIFYKSLWCVVLEVKASFCEESR